MSSSFVLDGKKRNSQRKHKQQERRKIHCGSCNVAKPRRNFSEAQLGRHNDNKEFPPICRGCVQFFMCPQDEVCGQESRVQETRGQKAANDPHSPIIESERYFGGKIPEPLSPTNDHEEQHMVYPPYHELNPYWAPHMAPTVAIDTTPFTDVQLANNYDSTTSHCDWFLPPPPQEMENWAHEEPNAGQYAAWIPNHQHLFMFRRLLQHNSYKGDHTPNYNFSSHVYPPQHANQFPQPIYCPTNSHPNKRRFFYDQQNVEYSKRFSKHRDLKFVPFFERNLRPRHSRSFLHRMPRRSYTPLGRHVQRQQMPLVAPSRREQHLQPRRVRAPRIPFRGGTGSMHDFTERSQLSSSTKHSVSAKHSSSAKHPGSAQRSDFPQRSVVAQPSNARQRVVAVHPVLPSQGVFQLAKKPVKSRFSVFPQTKPPCETKSDEMTTHEKKLQRDNSSGSASKTIGSLDVEAKENVLEFH